MSVETHVHRAVARVRREHDRTVEKRCKLSRFADDVTAMTPAAGGGATASPSGWTAARTASAAPGTTVDAVLTAFEDRCSDVAGAPDVTHDAVHEAVADELSRDVATALCGGDTAGALTPALQRAVLETTRERLAELDATTAALEAERDSLESVRAVVDDVCAWFERHDPTPLTDLGFDALRRRHEHLGEHLDCVDARAADRQAHLRRTTSVDGAVGIAHDTLVEYCYADADVRYPALSTLAGLGDACREARRALRDHLVRRV